MLLIKPPLVKKRPLKSVLITTILKVRNLALGMLPIIKPIVPQLCITELELPSKINKLITIVYNTSIDPLLYQLIAAKTAGACILPTNL